MNSNELDKLSKRLNLDIPAEKLELAFLHSSYVNELADPRGSNERLEFLGDAVIDLAVASFLYSEYPDADEGKLTKAKSVVVSRPNLTERARQINLSPYLRLGKGEEANGGRTRASNLGNAFESLVGVIFLERGYDLAKRFVLQCLQEDIDLLLAEQSATGDYKSLLQETAQRSFNCRPAYSKLGSKGQQHRKQFVMEVTVAGHRGVGRGRSKKKAEQAAAKQLYLVLEEF